MMHVEPVTKYSYSDPRSAEDAAASSSHPLPPAPPTTQEKPHKCPHRGCGRQFNRKYTLLEHTKTHTGEKPHVCPVRSCSKRFSTSGNLSRHKRLHGVIKPLECPVEGCYCTFPSDNKLDKHMQFHLGSPVHVCTIGTCGKTFSTTGNLNRHVKHHHPNETLRPLPPPQPNAPLIIQPPSLMAPQQLHVQIPSQQQVPYPVDMGYQFPSPRGVVNPPMKRVMDVMPPAFAPGMAQQYYSGASRWSGDFTRPSPAQVVPSQLPSPMGATPRTTRNPGIADVLSSIFDEMEYASTDPEKPLPAPPLQPQNLLDDMVNFHVAHIEL